MVHVGTSIAIGALAAALMAGALLGVCLMALLYVGGRSDDGYPPDYPRAF